MVTSSNAVSARATGRRLTKLSGLDLPIPGKLQDPLPADKAVHFYPCPNCGPQVDQRDLRQVFWHEGPDHEVLELEGDGNMLKFRKPK